MVSYSDKVSTIHGGTVYEAARRWGVSPDQVLDFSANVNPLGPPPRAVQALSVGKVAIESYPDSSEFITALSDKLLVLPESITLGNGSTALIFAVARALGVRRALLCEPAFGEYHRALEAVGARIEHFTLQERDGFHADFDLLRRTLPLKRCDLIILNNPHNPSGALCAREEITTLARAAISSGTYLLVDEAFIDYTPRSSVLLEAVSFTNLVVLRSLTKFYGMPGLRIGYAISHPEIARRITDQIEAWPVCGLTLNAARAAISDTVYEERTLSQNEIARERFQTALAQFGLTVFESAANFLLVKLPERDGAGLTRWLEPHRVLVRRCHSFKGLGDNFVRLAVRSHADNMMLARLIEQWLQVSRLRLYEKG
jgi:threonine-phosphate decarboxylase